MDSLRSIAFYSPVPGSGSTLLAMSFADYLATLRKEPVNLLSCDIQYPDGERIRDAVLVDSGDIGVFLPLINRNLCILCKACAKACVFGAIRIEKAISYINLEVDRCRACGACLNTCRYDAIGEQERIIGNWKKYSLPNLVYFWEGKLLAEDFFSIQLIQQLNKMPESSVLKLVDARSGYNYAALESLHEADVIVMTVDPSCFDAGYFDRVLNRLDDNDHRVLTLINYNEENLTTVLDFFESRNIMVIQGHTDLGLLPGGWGLSDEFKSHPDYQRVMKALYKEIFMDNKNPIQ